MKILYIGEIVGKAGVFCIKSCLPEFKKNNNIDYVIANGEGATGGFGIGKNHSIYLHKLGIDIITSGEKIFYKKDMVSHIKKASYILRPANYPPGNPGRGWKVASVGDAKIGIINLLGQSGFSRVHLSNPFTFLPSLVEKIKKETNTIIIDFHAATTAEKYSMFFHAQNNVSAVIGSHGKILTADARIMSQSTAVICDSGRTGSIDSVGGLDPEIEVKKFLTQVPELSGECWDRLEMQGVMLEIDNSGVPKSIEVVRESCSRGEDND